MSTVDGHRAPGGSPSSELVDVKLEAVVIPVADADRSNAFHDIEAGRDKLVSRGATVSGVFHSGAPGAQLDPEGTGGRVNGPDPDHKNYNSLATFEDPDGNSWLLQEVPDRLPGGLDPTTTSFNSAGDLAAALDRAESAGIEANPHGIVVDEYLRAGDNICAIGDVNGIWPLTHARSNGFLTLLSTVSD